MAETVNGMVEKCRLAVQLVGFVRVDCYWIRPLTHEVALK